MPYKVKEIFYSLQGEGFHVGRPTVFLRFAGCNLWSGKEEDRHKAICKFCDTDFINPEFVFKSPEELAKKVVSFWPNEQGKPYVVCTGGEPLLQLDEKLVCALAKKGFEIGVETNGTVPLQFKLDWICVSPKANAKLEILEGDELKLVYPQDENKPSNFEHLNFKHFYLQPKDCDELGKNQKLALDYCLQNPRWKLSLQMHKILRIR